MYTTTCSSADVDLQILKIHCKILCLSMWCWLGNVDAHPAFCILRQVRPERDFPQRRPLTTAIHKPYPDAASLDFHLNCPLIALQRNQAPVTPPIHRHSADIRLIILKLNACLDPFAPIREIYDQAEAALIIFVSPLGGNRDFGGLKGGKLGGSVDYGSIEGMS